MEVDQAVFNIYALSVALLVAKTAIMSLLTARQRFKNKIFISREDVVGMKDAKAAGTNEDVERVRRAHHNDLENIPIFILLAAVYMVVAQPCVFTAKMLFYGFTAARYFHTVVYLNEIRQPARALGFFAGLIITMFMCGKIVMTIVF